MHFEFKVEGGDFTGAGKASSEIKKVLKRLGIDPKLIKRSVIALYEAEVNVVAHANRGRILVDIDPYKIQMTLIDEGPGIENIEMAMKKGYSTASPRVREMGFGAGMGLPNILQNTDNFSIKSDVGIGTTVVLTNNLA